MKNRETLLVTLKECRLHEEVLREASDELGGIHFDEKTVQHIDSQQRRLLDQLAYRFSKLQDSMGVKLLPMLLDLAEEPLPQETPFAEKLQRLERLGALESVERWRQLREIRNQISHDYEDAPAIKAAVLNKFITEVGSLLDMWKKAEEFTVQYMTSTGDSV